MTDMDLRMGNNGRTLKTVYLHPVPLYDSRSPFSASVVILIEERVLINLHGPYIIAL